METEEERRRRRSSTASFYSIRNSRTNINPTAGDQADDASCAINTVMAVASVSDYNHIKSNSSAPPGPEGEKDDAVAVSEEVNTHGDTAVPPLAVQEMVMK